MIRALVDFFWGSHTLRIEGCENAIDLLMKYNVSYSALKKDGCAIKVTLSRAEAKYLEEILKKHGICYTVEAKKGIGAFARSLAARPGMIAGAIIFCFILAASTRYVWDIEVIGCKDIPVSEIEERLEDYGFSVGINFTETDLRSLCNLFMRDHDDISFMSINMNGTTAQVEIRELRSEERAQEDNRSPSVLVASRDAQIERFEISSGKVCTSVGQVVCKGDLLVSGAVDFETSFHLMGANGRVLGRTLHEIEVFCPESEVKAEINTEDGGALIKEKAVTFGKWRFDLNKNRNNSNKYSISDKDYAIIEKKDRVTLFGRIILPLVYNETIAYPIEEREIVYSSDEQKQIAQELLMKKFETELKDARILSIERSDEEEKTQNDQKGYKIKCRVEALENIAEKVFIGINIKSKDEENQK